VPCGQVCDHGAGTVLSLLESPVAGAPFAHAVAILTALASYKPFAAMVGEVEWRQGN
jgi:hypothetical protein